MKCQLDLFSQKENVCFVNVDYDWINLKQDSSSVTFCYLIENFAFEQTPCYHIRVLSYKNHVVCPSQQVMTWNLINFIEQPLLFCLKSTLNSQWPLFCSTKIRNQQTALFTVAKATILK